MKRRPGFNRVPAKIHERVESGMIKRLQNDAKKMPCLCPIPSPMAVPPNPIPPLRPHSWCRCLLLAETGEGVRRISLIQHAPRRVAASPLTRSGPRADRASEHGYAEYPGEGIRAERMEGLQGTVITRFPESAQRSIRGDHLDLQDQTNSRLASDRTWTRLGRQGLRRSSWTSSTGVWLGDGVAGSGRPPRPHPPHPTVVQRPSGFR